MYTTCRVGVLSSEISKHSKISPPPSLRSHLTSSPMGVLSGDYGTIALQEWKAQNNYIHVVVINIFMVYFIYTGVSSRYSP